MITQSTNNFSNGNFKIKTLIDKFFFFCKETKKEETTLFYYELKRYLKFLYCYKTNDINNEKINQFIINIKQNTKAKNNTINKTIKLLRLMYKTFSLKNDDLKKYPLLLIEKKRFPIFSCSDLIKINDYLKTLKNSNYPLIIEILQQTGLRQQEIINLKIKDFNFEEKSLYISFSKTRQDRYLFLNNKLSKKLKDYINNNKNNNFFFEQEKKKKLTKACFQSFYKRLKKQTGLKKAFTHMFRHNYITFLIEQNVNLTVVQNQAGHSNINTTMRYFHQSLSFQKKELEKRKII